MNCFSDIVELLDYCENHESNTSKQVIESIIYRLESAVRFMEQILPILNEYKDDMSEATDNLKVLYHLWCRKFQEIGQRPSPSTHLAIYSVDPPGFFEKSGPGRPKFNIEEETLLHFRKLGFSWKEISRLLLVSRWTLWRRARELGIEDRTGFSDIEDEELDHTVRAFMTSQGCMVGYSMVRGHLRDLGIKVQRSRIRASIARVDPVNTRIRWATVISRRTYSVPAPNSLWHIDGHHSLITWGFVIHGAIDGFSRLICFLRCSTNNRKETVENLFLESVEKYSWPSRIRTDYGGENVLVWDHMNAARGHGRGSVLVGSSMHNQRIERLWRDVFRCFGSVFYYTFQTLQETGLLDVTNKMHMFMLHYIYLPRINSAISAFVAAWNKHPIRTERNWSPEQIWTNGMIDRVNDGLCTVSAVVNDGYLSNDDLNWYGFDPGAPLPPDDGLSTVEVNDVDFDVPSEVLALLSHEIDPLANSTAFGMDIFERGVIFLQNQMEV